MELRRIGSKLDFSTLKNTVLLGNLSGSDPDKDVYNYFGYSIGIASKYNNIVVCGYTQETSFDLFTTYMDHNNLTKPTYWLRTDPYTRIHKDNDALRELVEPTNWLQQKFYNNMNAQSYTRGLMSGFFKEGTGTICVGTEDNQSTQKWVKAMFNPEPFEYSTSSGSSQTYGWVAQVQAQNISNTSGAQGYSNFTGTTTFLQKGYFNTIKLTPGFSGQAYREYWKVWIDMNGDGTLSDATECVFSGNGTSTVSGYLSIPTSAKSGPTRMRVSMRYGSNPPPTGTFSYGEVEDYTIMIDSDDYCYT